MVFFGCEMLMQIVISRVPYSFIGGFYRILLFTSIRPSIQVFVSVMVLRYRWRQRQIDTHFADDSQNYLRRSKNCNDSKLFWFDCKVDAL